MKQLHRKNDRSGTILFSIAIGVTAVFLLSPCLFQWFHGLEEVARRFLAPLGRESYKSGYVQSVGALIGTFLAITGALWTQARFERKADVRRVEEEKKALQIRFITVYYDLKLAFDDMRNLYAGFFAAVALPGAGQMEELRKLSETFHLYIDNSWIEHVSSMGSELETEELQEIFRIYGDICSLERYISSPQKNDYMTIKVADILGNYFEGDKAGKLELKPAYQEILERIRTLAGIESAER